MAMTNLSEVYLPTTGGTVEGDVEVNGSIVVNDGSGEGTTYDVASEITELKSAWDSVSPTQITISDSANSTHTMTGIQIIKSGNIVMLSALVTCAYAKTDTGYADLVSSDSIPDPAHGGYVYRKFDIGEIAIDSGIIRVGGAVSKGVSQRVNLTYICQQHSVSQFSGKQVGKLLWSGTWSSGSITVDGLSDYVLFAAYASGTATPMIGFCPPTSGDFRLFGGYFNTTPNGFAYGLTATKSGNTLTLTKAANINIAGTTITDVSIGYIYGII